jgi:hypothetical protein
MKITTEYSSVYSQTRPAQLNDSRLLNTLITKDYYMSLSLSLRIAAVVIIMVATTEYIFFHELLPPPFVVASILLVLASANSHWPIFASRILLFISVLVPIAALTGYLQGFLIIVVPILDAILFTWLLLGALSQRRGLPTNLITRGKHG